VAVAGNYSGYQLYARTSSVKTFPTFTGDLSAGTYIVIHSEAGSDDTTPAAVMHLYGMGQLTGTDNVISIRDSGGTIIDALCWAKVDGTWVTVQRTAFEAAITAGQWTGTIGGTIAQQESESFDATGGQSAGLSIGRDSNSTDTDNSGTAKNDWYLFTTQTEGAANPAGGTSGDILINEVAPSVTGGKDWIEFRNVSGTSKNIQYWVVKERTSTVKTFPSYTMSAGEYIVLHFNDSTADETTGDTNGNGYRDFYTTDSGLTGTDNVIILYDPTGTIIDAMAFSNRDGTWADAQQTAFNTIVNANEWTGTVDGGAATNEAESADWSSGSSTKSLGRDNASGVTDDNDKDDWYLIDSPTKGEMNPSSLASDVRIRINEVSFKASSSRDWVELYCVDDGNSGNGVDIGNCFFEDDGTIKTIAKGTTIKTGEYLVLQPASGCMTVTFIDVGQGDSILVQTPGDKRMLIDGGRSWAGEDRVLPYLDEQGISTIHLMVATHADAPKALPLRKIAMLKSRISVKSLENIFLIFINLPMRIVFSLFYFPHDLLQPIINTCILGFIANSHCPIFKIFSVYTFPMAGKDTLDIDEIYFSSWNGLK